MNDAVRKAVDALLSEILELFPLKPLPVGKAFGLKETYLDFRWAAKPNSAVAIPYNELPVEQLIANCSDTLHISPNGVFRHCFPAYLLLAARSLQSGEEFRIFAEALDGVLFLIHCKNEPKKHGQSVSDIHYLSRLDYLSVAQLQLIQKLIYLYIDMPMESYDTFDDEVIDGALEFLDRRIKELARAGGDKPAVQERNRENRPKSK